MGTEWEITLVASGGGLRRIPLGDVTTIGRAEDSHIFLPDQLLSRRHAEIQRRGDAHYLVDLGSTNGTYLNGSRIGDELALHDGDTISLGGNRLIVHARRSTPISVPLAELKTRFGAGKPEDTAQEFLVLPELREQNRALAALTRATSALLAPAALPNLLNEVLDLAFDMIPAQRGAILLLDPAHPAPVLAATRARPGHEPIQQLSRSIVARVVDQRMALLLRHVSDDPTLSAKQSIVSESIVSAVCAPLWLPDDATPGGKVLGLLYFDTRSERANFRDTDLQILTVLANVAATKMENTRLVEAMLKARVLEEDLRLAAVIQKSLMPLSAPSVPGYDLHGATRPCRTVGGDYYDFAVDGETLYLALGDVSGKGPGAAMLMVALRTAVRAHWMEGSLAQAARAINRTFCANVPDDQFATLFIARVSLPTGRFRYVNAGHNRPLLVRGGGETVEALASGGTVVGVFQNAAFVEGAVTVEPEDTVVVFSDGVSESWEDPDVADRRLAEVTRRGRSMKAEQIVDEVLLEVDRQEGRGSIDDRTVLVLKRDRGA